MTKIDIISGFLGAGKTTLIKRLLGTKLHDEKVVLIENEFGEIGIDSGFLKETKVDITELNQGCICCSLQGDFSKALQEIHTKFNPDRIIIEPSGVGKLSDIVKAVVDADVENTSLNALVCVCDANKAKMYLKNFGEFYIDQVKHAKTIFLSRTDVASEAKMEECLNIIRDINSDAHIVTTPVAILSDEALIDAYEAKNDDFEKNLLEEVARLHHEHHHHSHTECCCGEDDECECIDHDEHECGCQHHHDHDEHECGCQHHHDHDAEEVFTSLGIETTKKFSQEELQEKLDVLSDDISYGMILRAKGIVDGADGWYHFDMVPGESDIRHGEAGPIGRLCVIGSRLDKEKIKNLFLK